MDQSTQQQIKQWSQPPFDRETYDQIQLLESNVDELEDAFYKEVAFGTGGMRGIMGVGPNRINKYTIGRATQGLCNYIRSQNIAKPAAVIAYDCRHNSATYAQLVGRIFEANGIRAQVFEDLRPTPLLSFAVPYLQATVGIVITASHNPPKYNGYKVYWSDGGQIVPPQDQEIIAEINRTDYGDIQFGDTSTPLDEVDYEVEQMFLAQAAKVATLKMPTLARNAYKVVITSLHGTSITLLPQILRNAGYDVSIVEEQATPDGDFPTVDSPNPEEPAALAMGIELAKEIDAFMVIGTDPDADRLGIAVRNDDNNFVLLNGNESMAVMTHALLESVDLESLNKPFIASTVVSTPLMRKLAQHHNVDYVETLTGFKWIADAIAQRPDQNFIGGGEESFGFMVGDFVRDKDAITASLLACEIGARAQHASSTFYQELQQLYKTHGTYRERLISLVRGGRTGAKEIADRMDELRKQPPTHIVGESVIQVDDYKTGIRSIDGKHDPLNMPYSDVLVFTTDAGTRVAARPSGTEPKIKFYLSVNGTYGTDEALEKKMDEITQEMKLK